MNKTLVFGASTNTERYSFKAVNRLMENDFEVVPVGLKEGEINGLNILTGTPEVENLDTITLYIGPKHQPAFYDYFLSLKPKRIIFNPGTENDEFRAMAIDKGIKTEYACTLVMVATGVYAH
ncbi:MAG: putative CoA-binding protein [Sphingobacteriales bacterium]|jgi:predicted CoA-binding protein